MIDLRKVLITYLKTLHPRVYFQTAPTSAVYPYIVCDFPNSFSDGEGGETVTLDIEVWDMDINFDTTRIEKLMETINGNLDEDSNPTGLDKKALVTDKIAVVFFIDNKMTLIDDDKTIQRRKYIYSGLLIRR